MTHPNSQRPRCETARSKNWIKVPFRERGPGAIQVPNFSKFRLLFLDLVLLFIRKEYLNAKIDTMFFNRTPLSIFIKIKLELPCPEANSPVWPSG